MYAKVFASLWDGSLRGERDAQLVFVYMLAHADEHGEVNIIRDKIVSDTGVGMERDDDIHEAIALLEAADEHSRSREQDGRRIVPLDAHRNWGWKIVNYEHYRNIRNALERREQNRLAQQRWAAKQTSSDLSKPKQSSAASAKEEEEAEAVSEAKASSCPKEPSDENLSVEEWFEKVFWKRYPKKEAKAKALKAMKAIFKGVSRAREDDLADQILAGLIDHKARWDDPRFIPLPASWINARRWEDELEPPR